MAVFYETSLFLCHGIDNIAAQHNTTIQHFTLGGNNSFIFEWKIKKKKKKRETAF